jgi:eukaryotic-like serine/threonine-protein kinase
VEMRRTITQLPDPPGTTQAYAGDPVPAKASAERPRVRLLTGAGTAPSVDLEQLLRKRLGYFSLVGFVFCSVWLVAGLLFDSDKFSSATTLFTQPPSYGVVLCMVAIEGSLALLLWRRTTVALTHLRRMEWVAFASPFVLIVWNLYFDLTLWLPDLRAGQAPRLTIAGATAIPFVTLIVTYGVFIPNAGRRCALATGLIASGAVIPCAVILLTGNVPPQHTSQILVILCAWLGLAIAVVVYGATRVEFLRNEALEARKLGQYLLRRQLGAGGMGEVYYAEHRLLRRPAAIKLIRADRAGDAKNLLRFEREVQITATLTHPNTVQVFDYGHAEDGTFYYVMEYLPGLTLDQLVKEHGPLPAARAVHFLRQICAALREAHAVGLIHRDIKPGNVMICARGGIPDIAKLLDFGLVLPLGSATADEKLTQEGAIAGTPAYMSPEQAGGQDLLDARSDIYSVGALAYFLITGQPPFAGRSWVKMLAAHLYETPEPLTERCPDVPADLEAVALRCLAKNPADRFQDAASLESALVECQRCGTWTTQEAEAWWQGRSEADGRLDEQPANDRWGRTKR